jgi:hypothetical protein
MTKVKRKALPDSKIFLTNGCLAMGVMHFALNKSR